MEKQKTDEFDLERFVQEQEFTYPMVLEELRRGRKPKDGIWYIFPQLRGVGFREHAERRGLTGLEEAQSYYSHEVLGPRLKQCVETLLIHHSKTAEEIFGDIDAMKVRACLTLFSMAAPHDTLFVKALQRFYNGDKDQETIDWLHHCQAYAMSHTSNEKQDPT